MIVCSNFILVDLIFLIVDFSDDVEVFCLFLFFLEILIFKILFLVFVVGKLDNNK